MSVPLLVAGIGNSSVKLGVTRDSSPESLPRWLHHREASTADFQPASVESMLSPEPHRWLVAGVQRATEQRLRQWVQGTRPADDYRQLTYRDLPIEIDVDAPERVGMDRLATAVAANRLKDRDRPAVIVDAGTALTVNLITEDGVFRGGVILPGFRLTAQALADGTDLLPLIATDLTAEDPPVIGRSTEAAIRSGLFWGSVGAVRELVCRIGAQVGDSPQLFVTGGDAQRLARHLAHDARFVPDLVLIGIASSPLAFQA